MMHWTLAIDWTFGLPPWLWILIVFPTTIFAALLLYAMLMNWTNGLKRPTREQGRVNRSWGHPIVFQFELHSPQPPDVERIASALSEWWQLERDPEPAAGVDLAMVGGNERRARFWGIHDFDIIPFESFSRRRIKRYAPVTDLRVLPTRVEVTVLSPDADGSRIQLRVIDDYDGWLIRERGLESRYAVVAEDIRRVVRTALESPAPAQ